MRRHARSMVCLAASLAALPCLAEPAFAVRTGHRCGQCHVNRSGGGLRTAFGSLYTQLTLPARTLSWREENNLLPADPDARFAVGADVRLQQLAIDPEGAETSVSSELSEANAYFEARLLPGRVSLYLDETIGPGGAAARELFGMVDFGPGRGYLKVGKFLPAYGWRLPDDAAFIRQNSGFSYRSPDIGVEVGFEPGSWSLHLSAVNGAGGGSDDNRSKRFTLQAVKRQSNWRIGIQGSNNIRGGVTVTNAGFHAGANFGRLALLGEGDWVETTAAAGTDHRLLGLLEADVLIARGVNLKLAHDWIDPDLDVSTDARTRDSVGIEYIPLPFVQLRAFARYADGPPQVPGARGTQLDLELHLFF